MPKVAKWIGDAVEGLMKTKFPMMKVVDKVYVTPHFIKVKFYGDIADMDFQPGYAVAIRVNDTEFRNYTPYFFNKGKGSLEIIFHMHGSASGTEFIRSLEIGHQLRISIPRGKKMYDSSVSKYIFFGDETSLGLAYALQAVVKQEHQSIQFYFELDKENIYLPELLGIKSSYVFENKVSFTDEELISNILFKNSLHTEMDNKCFVLTGNAKSVQTIRNVLKRENAKGRILAQAYWAEGKQGL